MSSDRPLEPKAMQPGLLYRSWSGTIVECIMTSGKTNIHFTGKVISSSDYPIGEISNDWYAPAFIQVEQFEEPQLTIIL
jgi:hypothetical protein